MNNIVYTFTVGDPVYVLREDNYVKATIIDNYNDGIYRVEFEDGSAEIKLLTDLNIYTPCNTCDVNSSTIGKDDLNLTYQGIILDTCGDPNYLTLKK